MLNSTANIAPEAASRNNQCRSSPSAFVTISVDDGHASDLRTADLLEKFGLRATFYIPRSNAERPVMAPVEIVQVSQAFEIGGHTLHHVTLTEVDQEVAREEIRGSKDWLENLLGRPVASFCYPRGEYDSTTRSLVEEAGFLGARTCNFNLNGFPSDPFETGVSTHAFPHSPAIQVRHALRKLNFRGIVTYLSVHEMATDWLAHFRKALDWVERNGGVAHLYLHSWEIEERNDWDKLYEALRDAAGREAMSPITNGELFALANGSGHSPGPDMSVRPALTVEEQT